MGAAREGRTARAQPGSRAPDDAPVFRADGPYVVSGGWWQGEMHREYYFAETKSGRILWVFFDRRRRRWFLQGEVE